jgi:hypothetical protein
MNPEIINAPQTPKRKRSGGGRAFHSRLEPFVDFIRDQRQRRRTWQEIATELSGTKGCSITAQGVHQFYRRYLQRRGKGHWENETIVPETQLERPHPPASQPLSRPAPLPVKPAFKRPDLSTIKPEEFT